VEKSSSAYTTGKKTHLVMYMTLKQKIVRCLRCATCDKESLNRCLLKWCKCFKEVEKELNRCKKC